MFRVFAPYDPALPRGGTMLLESFSETAPDFAALPPDRVVEHEQAGGSVVIYDHRAGGPQIDPPA
jgi:hypothetical protein